MSDIGLGRIVQQLSTRLEKDTLVQNTVIQLRDTLQVDRVILYYFYSEWKGQVTFESLRSREFSILGETGPDECFNDEYAALYLQGRIKAISDIETEAIHPCHRDFLRQRQVRANLVVPVLTQSRLWGLLIAHNCQSPRSWSSENVIVMQEAAKTLGTAPAIAKS